MNHHDQQLIAELKPKQQTFNILADDRWQQLPRSQCRACLLAVAELIFQVAQAQHSHQQISQQSSQENE